jgi:membrane protein
MTLLYLVMPNTRVRFLPALAGGLLAGSLWELGKLAFTWASSTLLGYDAVYGAFGVLPAFLLWLQIGWIIVLFGCKVAYAVQHAGAYPDGHPVRGIGQSLRELLAVLSMVEVVRAHRRGDPPPTSTRIAEVTGAPMGVEKRVLNRLVRGGFLVRVGDCELHDDRRRVRDGVAVDLEGFLPARDPTLITVNDVLEAFRRHPDVDPAVEAAVGETPLARQVGSLLTGAREAARRVTAGVTLAEAADRFAGHGSVARTKEEACASRPSTSARTRSTS